MALYGFADEPRRPPGRRGSDDYYHPGSGTQTPDNSTTRTTPQQQWTDSGKPDCPGGQARYIGPYDEHGNATGGASSSDWECVSGGGGGGGGFGGGFNYTTPAYTGPNRPQYNIDPAPEFHAPQFTPPNADSIYSDPSYQFRLEQGQRALESSAAARGVTRTGGTLQGILEYGQNFASQEYSNIYNRALQHYDRQYRAALDEFNPQFQEWQTLTGAEIGAGNLAFQAALDRYFFGINDEFRREQMIFNGPQNL